MYHQNLLKAIEKRFFTKSADFNVESHGTAQCCSLAQPALLNRKLHPFEIDVKSNRFHLKKCCNSHAETSFLFHFTSNFGFDFRFVSIQISGVSSGN